MKQYLLLAAIILSIGCKGKPKQEHGPFTATVDTTSMGTVSFDLDPSTTVCIDTIQTENTPSSIHWPFGDGLGNGHSQAPELDTDMFGEKSGHLLIGFPTNLSDSQRVLGDTDEVTYPITLPIIGMNDNLEYCETNYYIGLLGINIVAGNPVSVWCNPDTIWKMRHLYTSWDRWENHRNQGGVRF